MLDCLQCSNHDSSQEISVYSNSHSYLSTSYNNISVIFMSKLYGHKSTRTASSGCFRIGFSCSIYSRGITKSFTELCLMWSSTLSPLPSLSVKLTLASWAMYSSGLHLKIAKLSKYYKRTKPQVWLNALYFKGLISAISVGLFNVNQSNYLFCSPVNCNC